MQSKLSWLWNKAPEAPPPLLGIVLSLVLSLFSECLWRPIQFALLARSLKVSGPFWTGWKVVTGNHLLPLFICESFACWLFKFII